MNSILNVFTRTDNNSQLYPPILRLTVNRNSTSFYLRIVDQTTTTPKEEKGTIQKNIAVSIEGVEDYIIKL
ncbi:hypothetical protein [Phocaeicola coprocola]|uniref:hypothetical protein n=1 Tax=Phocaeicola coprocola TaxID=310298 RepID=UPI0026716FF0|nr:hypothetical protein [Phocaeicola coprocola]